jgi:hypothetical protein
MTAAIHIRRSIAAAFLSVLALATSVSAECAWVLWDEGTSPPTYETTNSLVSAFDTKQACEQALTKRVTVLTTLLKAKDTGVTVDEISGMRRVTAQKKMKGGSVWISVDRFVCLPDTVDPRGPKGK